MEQPCQLVTLRLMDNDAVLGKLDRMTDSCTNDLRHIKGFCNKIRCTDPQAFHLCALFGGQHDHRYAPQLIVAAKQLQQAVSIHLRHMQVEYHERKLQLVPLYDAERYHTIFGIADFIPILQHHSEYLSCDIVIINDQYASAKPLLAFQQFFHTGFLLT